MLDPLFHLPLVTGLLLALVLPLLGAALLLRGEWLAALGLAHVAAAGALASLALGLPALPGGVAAALGGGVFKATHQAHGNLSYAFMILGGWTALLLIAANTGIGSAAGYALMEGQLYFAAAFELSATLVLALLAAGLLPWVLPRLLRFQLLPDLDRANGIPVWRWLLAFDLLTAVGVAIGTATIGLMATFALVLIPPWLSFRLATGWYPALALAALIGVLGYLGAFALALVTDQPFGPVLVAVLLALAGLGARRGRGGQPD